VITRGRVDSSRAGQLSPQPVKQIPNAIPLSGYLSGLAVGRNSVHDGELHSILARGSCTKGCHGGEVKMDPDTGRLQLRADPAVDDFRAAQSPLAVCGQVQGGVAQAIGQPLMECVAFDGGNHQPLSDSRMDDALPRAPKVPEVRLVGNALISRTNVFFASACGEAGASGAPPATMNAIAGSLRTVFAARTLLMPARTADIWHVIHGG